MVFSPNDLPDLVARYTATSRWLEHSGSTLNGSTQYWKDTTAVRTAWGFIVAGWVKPTDATPVSAEVIWSVSDEATTQEYWLIQLNTAGTLTATVGSGGSTNSATTTNAAPADGQWVHFVVEFQADGDIVAVLDGSWANRGTVSSALTPTGLDNTLVGAVENSGGVASHFAGSLGRIDVWNSEGLTQEIAEDLERGDAPHTVAPKGLAQPNHSWFDQSTDGTDSGATGGFDLTGNGTPGTHAECYVWRDRAGYRHLRTLTAGPDYSSNALGTGKGGLVFDDSNTEYMIFVGTAPVAIDPFTAWCWAASDDAAVRGAPWGVGKNAAGHYYYAAFDTDTNVDFNANAGATDGVASTSTSWSTNTIHLITTIAASATSRTVRLDGAGTGTDTASRSPGGIDQISIGASVRSTVAYPLSGAVFELSIIDDTATAQEETDMEAFTLYSDDALRFPSQLPNRVAHYTASQDYLEHSGCTLNDVNQYFKRTEAIRTSYPFTVSVWWKQSSATNSESLFAMTDEATTNERWDVHANGGGLKTATIASKAGGTAKNASTSNTYSLNEWNHVVAYFGGATDREIVLNGNWSSRGTVTGDSTPSGLDNTTVGAREDSAGAAGHFGGRLGRVDVWFGDPTNRQTFAENLYAGNDPAGEELGQADHTYFDHTTDGSDTGGTGGKPLTGQNTPGTHAECYIWRDRSGNGYHLLALSEGPDWSSDALGLGKKGLVFDDANSEWMRDNSTPLTAGPLSAFAWFASNDAASNQAVWWLGDKDASDNNWYVSLAGASTDFVRITRNETAGTGTADTTTTYVANTIHLATFTSHIPGSGIIRLDGTGSGEDTSSRTPTGVDRVAIGALGDPTPSNYFSGAIYEVVLQNKEALSNEELDMEAYDLFAGEWSASFQGSADLAGALSGPVAITASIQGSADLAGALSGTIAITASIQGSADLAGVLSALITLNATMQGSANLVPDIGVAMSPSIGMNGRAALGANLELIRYITNPPRIGDVLPGNQIRLIVGEKTQADWAVGNYSGDKYIRLTGFSTTINDSFSTTGFGTSTQERGSTWNNVASELWITGRSSHWQWRLSGFSSTVLDSDDLSGVVTRPGGCTYFGGDQYVADDSGNKIFAFSGFSTTVNDSFSPPLGFGFPVGIDFTHENLIWTRQNFEVVLALGFSSTVLDSVYSLAYSASGADSAGWDGGDLFTLHSTESIIYQTNGFSSAVVESVNLVGSIRSGLGYMGGDRTVDPPAVQVLDFGELPWNPTTLLKGNPYFNLEEISVTYESKSLTFSEIATPYIGNPTFPLEKAVQLDLDFGSGYATYFQGRIQKRQHVGRNNDEGIVYTAYGMQDLADEITVLNSTGIPRVVFTVGTTILSVTDEGTEITTTYAKSVRDAINDLFTLMTSPLNANSIGTAVDTLSLSQFTVDMEDSLDIRNTGFTTALTQLSALQPGMRPYWDDVNARWTFVDILNTTTLISQIDSVQQIDAIFDINTGGRYTAVRLIADVENQLDDKIETKANTDAGGWSLRRATVSLKKKWDTQLEGDWSYYKSMTWDPEIYEDDYFWLYRRWYIPNSIEEPWAGTPIRFFAKHNTNNIIRWQRFQAKANFRRREVIANVPQILRGDIFQAGNVKGVDDVIMSYYPRDVIFASVVTSGGSTLVTTEINANEYLTQIRYPHTGWEGTAYTEYGVQREFVELISPTEVTTENAKQILDLHKDVVVQGSVPFAGDPIENFLNLQCKLRMFHSTKLTGIQSTDAHVVGYTYSWGRGDSAQSNVDITTDKAALLRN